MVAVFALIVYAFNFPEHTAKNFAYPIPNRLQTGDVILRDSKGILGSFFRNFSREERKYSHAGFIFIGLTELCTNLHYIN